MPGPWIHDSGKPIIIDGLPVICAECPCEDTPAPCPDCEFLVIQGLSYRIVDYDTYEPEYNCESGNVFSDVTFNQVGDLCLAQVSPGACEWTGVGTAQTEGGSPVEITVSVSLVDGEFLLVVLPDGTYNDRDILGSSVELEGEYTGESLCLPFGEPDFGYQQRYDVILNASAECTDACEAPEVCPCEAFPVSEYPCGGLLEEYMLTSWYQKDTYYDASTTCGGSVSLVREWRINPAHLPVTLSHVDSCTWQSGDIGIEIREDGGAWELDYTGHADVVLEAGEWRLTVDRESLKAFGGTPSGSYADSWCTEEVSSSILSEGGGVVE